ncbi:MAG: efflux RND transporter periplasmic adaptor subunit [Candidatus Riflebacteria bacterium]|nr:efflux RND transporter periplasmic adaptor subunit [Candidatus Riflebacteria bacterium]
MNPTQRPFARGILALTVALITGCGEGGSSGSKAISAAPPPPVMISTPIVRAVTDYDYYEGRISAVHTVDIRPQVKGYLTRIMFKDGDVVRGGDLLIEIDPRPYKAEVEQARAQLASSEAQLKLARAEFTRYTALAAKGVATKEDADTYTSKQGTATADTLKAKAALDEAELNLAFTRIVAPISGRIGRRMVDIGNLVDASSSSPLATIVSIDPMYVYFDIDERALLRYREVHHHAAPSGTTGKAHLKDLKIPVEVALEGEVGYPHVGAIDFADNRVNKATGTIPVRGVLSNKNYAFIDGLRARVRLPVSDAHDVLLITEKAIGAEQGRRFVYVVDEKNVATRRDVTVEREHDRLRAVQGLKQGEKIVVTGIQRLRDGATVEPRSVTMPDSDPVASGAK